MAGIPCSRTPYQAYDTLSDGMKAMLDPLTGIFSSHKGRVVDTRAARAAESPKENASVARVAEHPVVRTHPETGRKALYVSEGHTDYIKDMDPQESEELLQELFEFSKRPEFIYRHVWQPHDLIFWDNRCTQHFALNDYQGQRREMNRVTVCGDRPV